MHPADPADRLDRVVESHDELPELARERRVEVVHVEVLAGLEEQLHRHRRALHGGEHAPVVVDPHVVVVRLRARAAGRTTGLAGAGPVGLLTRLDGPHLQIADEREDRPVDEGGKGQVGARSGHREIMPSVRRTRRHFSRPGARLLAWSNGCHS